MKSVLLPPVQLCTHTAGASFSRAKSAPSLFSPPPLLPPPLPHPVPVLFSPPLPCPALLPHSPRLPAVLLLLLLYTINRPQCAAARIAATEDDRCQCGQGSRPENSCCTQGGEEEAAEDVVIDCHLLKPSLNNGCLRRHAEVSLQFQGDLLGGAHLPRGRHLHRIGHQQE